MIWASTRIIILTILASGKGLSSVQLIQSRMNDWLWHLCGVKTDVIAGTAYQGRAKCIDDAIRNIRNSALYPSVGAQRFLIEPCRLVRHHHDCPAARSQH